MRAQPQGRLTAALALIAASASLLAARALDLRAVLTRAGEYVEQYQRDFSLLIADERYLQELLPAGPNSSSAVTERRLLVSEFALVQVQDADRTLWLAFRDVLEVDGQPVHGRAEHLQRLFVTPPSDALAQARAIALESARYNVGALVRTVNVPTIALEFLAAVKRRSSRFSRGREETLQGVHVWAVAFEERGRPTLIRTPAGEDVPATGVAWIDPESGRVLRTRIELKRPRNLTTRITVIYARDDRLSLWVPVEMDEVYDTDSWRITGRATYTNYRRFETSVRLKGPVGGIR